ncbi:MAG: hypothetical protein ACOX8K_11860, partial [Lachnospiraceae bacterium]
MPRWQIKLCKKAFTARTFLFGLFYSAPGGARFQQVQVLNPPGSGKDIAEGKGVHREVESEGSWMWG